MDRTLIRRGGRKGRSLVLMSLVSKMYLLFLDHISHYNSELNLPHKKNRPKLAGTVLSFQ
jgi:hypothetical protein